MATRSIIVLAVASIVLGDVSGKDAVNASCPTPHSGATTIYPGMNILNKGGWTDINHFFTDNYTVCLAMCCANSTCHGFTFTSAMPRGDPACPKGSKCCWLKSGLDTTQPDIGPEKNCVSGTVGIVTPPPTAPPPPRPPTPYYTPTLDYVMTIAERIDGNLRDPSEAVRDPVTGLWHFWVDFMAGSIEPGWHAEIHHYSSQNITGPWTSHGKAINHSTDPNAWDSNGTFSPSVIYSPDEKLWYLFYSATSTNYSAFKTCAQLVASSSSPDGPWTKLGVVAQPTGQPPDWGSNWNGRRVDSGRALIIGGQKGYWTKGVTSNNKATEGLYIPVNQSSFAPPYREYEHNPIFPAPSVVPDGYENCEFFMGPPYEKGIAEGLLHIWCNWHGSLNGKSVPHFVSDLTESPNGTNWTYVDSLSLKNTASPSFTALEPTPVYQGGPAGDITFTQYFIGRMHVKDKGPGSLVIGLFKLAWLPPVP